MLRDIPATQARVHFGEVMRKAVEQNQHFVVHRSGQPQVVILSLREYERLKAASAEKQPWRQLVAEARARVAQEEAKRPLPPPEIVIREMRVDRDEQLLDLR